jgi:hypothetical protein
VKARAAKIVFCIRVIIVSPELGREGSGFVDTQKA